MLDSLARDRWSRHRRASRNFPVQTSKLLVSHRGWSRVAFCCEGGCVSTKYVRRCDSNVDLRFARLIPIRKGMAKTKKRKVFFFFFFSRPEISRHPRRHTTRNHQKSHNQKKKRDSPLLVLQGEERFFCRGVSHWHSWAMVKLTGFNHQHNTITHKRTQRKNDEYNPLSTEHRTRASSNA